MPKKKQFISTKKQSDKIRKNAGPETANEYLAAGVDFEEAGEKWRAGDAAKSLRFFIRAIDDYDAGLQKFPRSFDLAYNKARLQYEVAQQPRLLEHLPTPLVDLLRVALDSHRLALTIDQDNADLLFNTAQVLTSLAEDVSEGRTSSQSSKDEGLNHFQEVLELLQRCLNVQEFKFTQAQENAAQESETHIDPGDRDHSARSSSASDVSEEEVWASVEEPVTKDTLIDTALAQMDTLTAICGLGSFNSGLAWIEEYYRTTLQDKITLYLEGTGRYHEAALAKANFISALSDAAFRSGRLDLATYETELNVAFSHQDLNLSADPRGLCDKADAELAFNASIQASIQQAQTKELIQVGSICWKHITKALDSLTAASKIPDAQNLAQIHLRRGDCELWRLRLGEAPLKYELTIKSVPTLLKNAEVYYRGAAALGSRSGGAKDEQKEAEVKEVIAAGLAGATQRFLSLLALEKDAVESVVEDMKDEGLLGPESLKSIGRVFG